MFKYNKPSEEMSMLGKMLLEKKMDLLRQQLNSN